MAKYLREMKSDVEIHDESKVFKGYTLYSPMYGYNAWLIDMNGNICHSWELKNPTSNHCRLTSNGTLFWHGRGPDANEELQSNGTELVEYDWDGNEIWRYDDDYLNHDFVLLDNGNILLLRYCDIPKDIQKNIKGGIPGTEINGKIYGISIHEINRKKEIIWEWYNYEHLDINKDMECPLDPRMVWGYTNSIAAFPNGDLIICMRHFNTIARIDKKTGDIIWRWGPEYLIGHPHCVSVLDNGNVMLFDNGLHRRYFKSGDPLEIGTSFETSRILEVDTKTNEVVWDWVDPKHLVYTNICGSAQRLPNGNTLICESKKGIFYELSHDKEIVWKYISPFVIKRPAYFGWSQSKIVFQVHRYAPDFKGFMDKDLDPEKLEWIIQEKSKDTLNEEEIIAERLSRTGY